MGNRGGKDNKGVDRMKSIHVWKELSKNKLNKSYFKRLNM